MEEKLEVKQFGAHQPRDIVITQTAGKSNHGFNVEWFLKKNYKALFCFPCLLFAGDGTWSRTGCKHLSERIAKHESSGSPLDNAVKLGLLGRVNVAAQVDSAYRRFVEQHNKQVEKNGYVLSRIITCKKNRRATFIFK